MADIVQEWTQGLDRFRAHQAVALLLFYLYQSDQVQRDEIALREALAEFVRGLDTRADAAANPVTGSLMTFAPLEDVLRELTVHRALQVWDDEFTQKGVQMCWRVGLIGEAWPLEALSSMAQLVVNDKGGIPSFAWGVIPVDNSRSRWRWPLRVGILPDDHSVKFTVENALGGVHEKLVQLLIPA